MSYWYKIQLDIPLCKSEMVNDIHEAVREHWDFTDLTAAPAGDGGGTEVDVYLSGEGQSSHGGLVPLLREIVGTVWKINNAYRSVTVRSLCLEDLPWEDHNFNEEDYDDVVQDAAKK